MYTNPYRVAMFIDHDGEHLALVWTFEPAFDPNGRRVGEVRHLYFAFDGLYLFWLID